MMSCNVSSQSWMISMKLAQDNWSKGFTFETSAQFIGSELLWMVSGLEKLFKSLLNRMEQFSQTSHRCTSRKKGDGQNTDP